MQSGQLYNNDRTNNHYYIMKTITKTLHIEISELRDNAFENITESAREDATCGEHDAAAQALDHLALINNAFKKQCPVEIRHMFKTIEAYNYCYLGFEEPFDYLSIHKDTDSWRDEPIVMIAIEDFLK